MLDAAVYGRCGVARIGELSRLGHNVTGRAWTGLAAMDSGCDSVVVRNRWSRERALTCPSVARDIAAMRNWSLLRLREVLANVSMDTRGARNDLLKRIALIRFGR